MNKHIAILVIIVWVQCFAISCSFSLFLIDLLSDLPGKHLRIGLKVGIISERDTIMNYV